jgi:hypothetical protein
MEREPVITWLWLTGTPAALFTIGIAVLRRRSGTTVAGMIAYWRMRRRPEPNWKDHQ